MVPEIENKYINSWRKLVFYFKDVGTSDGNISRIQN
jgi:hypothetical protein